jgi:hypothetical protein
VNQVELAQAFRTQADWCEKLGSPLYHALLLRIAEDIDCSGPCWSVVESHASTAERSLLPLRFLAGIHRLVLENRLPELARYYPSAGGTADLAAAQVAFIGTIVRQGHTLETPKTVQTNEVSRSCALLPGFLAIARRTGLPLRLLEIGCSAGLNLRWDCFAYETARGICGDANSPLRFGNVFAGEPPPLDTTVSVSERRGCDLNPIDPNTEEGRLTLLSFVWPDQTERFRQLSKAIEIARHVPAEVDRSDAIPWLESQLAQIRPGVATVVFHSIVRLYFSDEARGRLDEILTQAKESASNDAPLAWLTMEPGEKEANVDLTIWPGGERIRIAEAGFHGRNVTILVNGDR